MGDKPRAELFGALHTLYQSRDYSDLVIFARDSSRHPVHRAILCPRSHFFHIAVKERRWRDGTEGHLTLAEDDPEVVRLLVEYFYLLDYDPIVPPPKDAESASIHGSDKSDALSVRTGSTDAVQYGHVYGTSAVSAFGGPAHREPRFSATFNGHDRRDSSLTVHAIPGHDFSPFGDRPPIGRGKSNRSLGNAAPEPSPLATAEPNLVLHAKMYAAGDRYGVAGLKSLALDKFKIQLTRHWDMAEFAEAIHVVYNTTPSSDKDMREAVADTIGWHGSKLLDKAEVECAVMEINGLAYELLKRSRRAEPEFMG
ncbi:hypothetical protein BAUCODRAFT_36217 [Baudoinia panamericana UAMH 10762]|uniref:BTB domain-containing protein n=1 Tax=Baudoinia panamericana (strain UAMH 10762) TaxID=717646 RepID=M2LHV7_BAUPA|nr:uncharacterized protein BAUCODRAFT_36217 [Baudoinia panamericana UAMH 10762]EMC93767.1 hypothetical protein BAUCODRAFT_36217 [Baudoinia panamericana UAMH 10762]